MWEATTSHAKTCVDRDDKVYVYSAPPHGTIFVDSVFNLVRVEISGVDWPLHQLRGQAVSYFIALLLPASSELRTERWSSKISLL